MIDIPLNVIPKGRMLHSGQVPEVLATMTLSKPSIAIVEDDSDQLHSIEEFLLDSGYSVWGAGSAEAFYKGFTCSARGCGSLGSWTSRGWPFERGVITQVQAQRVVIILSAILRF